MNSEEVTKALAGSLATQTAYTWILENQSAARPTERPYGTVRCVTDKRIGTPEETQPQEVTVAVDAVSTVNKKFTIAGNRVDKIKAGGSIMIAGSTGNDGGYRVAAAVYLNGNTVITTEGAIPSSVADGTLSYAWYEIATKSQLTMRLTIYGQGKQNSLIMAPMKHMETVRGMLWAGSVTASTARFANDFDISDVSQGVDMQTFEPAAEMDVDFRTANVEYIPVDLLERYCFEVTVKGGVGNNDRVVDIDLPVTP